LFDVAGTLKFFCVLLDGFTPGLALELFGDATEP
jgi:hypothetical protein